MKKFLFFLLCMVVLLPARGQMDKGTKYLHGSIVNSFNHQVIFGTRVYLMHTDSTVVDSFLMDPHRRYNFGNAVADWVVKLEGDGDYVLRFTHPDYFPVVKKVSVKLYRRETYKDLGEITMRRRPKEKTLGEATVKATRIKFYYKNDTLVYNADAFQLQEGSMLDALIRQLPGAELKDDGRIYVNGRYVESLMLNGKDFFKGNNSVLLDNLPAYMVEKVKVYDKNSQMSEFTGHGGGGKSYVMDVGLKREYSIGWIANAEAGAGTKDRYMSRLFATRFTPQSHLAFYGTMNNLNDTRKPGQDGQWTPADLTGGLQASKIGGLDYEVTDKRHRFEVSGNAQLSHSGGDYQSRTQSENFLKSGNTFGRATNSSRSTSTSFDTRHQWAFRYKNLQRWTLSPHLNYQHYANQSSSVSGVLDKDPAQYANVMDSLLIPALAPLMAQHLLNRSVQSARQSGHSLGADIQIDGRVMKKHDDDNFIFSSGASYSDSRSENGQKMRVDYPQSGVAGSIRNYTSRQRGKDNYSFYQYVGYSYRLPINMYLDPGYRYRQSYSSGRRDAVNNLAGANGADDAMLYLPDTLNSYLSHQLNRTHEVSLKWYYEYVKTKGTTWASQWTYDATFPLSMERSRLHYQRAAIDTTMIRHFTFFTPSLHIKGLIQDTTGNHTYDIAWQTDMQAPALSNLIPRLRDDLDPLNVTVGATRQSVQTTHNLTFCYTRYVQCVRSQLSLYADYHIIQNKQIYAYAYDRLTGIRTFRPDNADGQWWATLSADYSRPIDHMKRLMLSTHTFLQHFTNVEKIDYARSIVRTELVQEQLKLDYGIGSLHLGLRTSVSLNHASSHREDFSTINAWNYHYGLTGQVNLPWKMQISTDFTVFSRRGYEDHSMNTDDLVWNARLTRRMMQGNLLLMLDGFDLLHQLSSVTRSIDAQGRTETWTNVLPNYLMFHVLYRLNLQPKKKGNAQ